MKYKKVIEAIFIKRPNRFIAHVEINGKEEIVHLKNTGRCKELLRKGARLILEDCSHIENRKTKYSLISVWKDNILVNMDSQVPNLVVYQALKDNKINILSNLTMVKREKTYKNSRYDIYFEKDDIRGFIEVKGVTLENDGIAAFPDAPTERGRKHVLEMIKAKEEGYMGIIFFLIQMKGPRKFVANVRMDPDFSQALSLAKENGIIILAYDSIVTENSIEIGSPIEIEI